MTDSQAGATLPGAGWYTDPQDAAQERWWDGTQWAEHRRPRPPAVAPQAAYAAYPTPQYRAAPVVRPSGMSKLGKNALTIGIVAAAFFLLGLLMMLLGGAVQALNWMLVLGVFMFPIAIILGIIAGIVGIVVAARRS